MEGESIATATIEPSANIEMDQVQIEDVPETESESEPEVEVTNEPPVIEVILEQAPRAEHAEELQISTTTTTSSAAEEAEAEAEAEIESAIAAIDAISHDAQNVIYRNEMELEAADFESTKKKNHRVLSRSITIFAMLVAFVFICIAIFYQVEWRRQQIEAQIPKGHTRFYEEVDDTIAAPTTTTTTAAPVVIKTTTEYIITNDYYEELYNEQKSTESDSDEYVDYKNIQSDEPTVAAMMTLNTNTATTTTARTNKQLEAKLQKWSDCAMKRNFPLLLLPLSKDYAHKQTVADDIVGATIHLNAQCLQCICETATQNCMSSKNGPFMISHPYWLDGGSVKLKKSNDDDDNDDDEKFHNCIDDACCAAETVTNFIKKYSRDCNNNGKIDCMDHAMLHILGPTRCKQEDMSVIHNFRYKNCMGE